LNAIRDLFFELALQMAMLSELRQIVAAPFADVASI
jgi:hypothetical protein